MLLTFWGSLFIRSLAISLNLTFSISKALIQRQLYGYSSMFEGNFGQFIQ